MIDQLSRYLAYYTHARSKYYIQSPKAYDFVMNVLDDDKMFYAFHPIEVRRENLLRDTSQITIEDHGAGSKKMTSNTRSIKDIAATSLSTVKQCQRLFKLVEHYQLMNIVELGSSLGISAAYLASGNKLAKVISLEGDPSIASNAKQTFKELRLDNVDLRVGTFKNLLPEVLKSMPEIDLAFIDGHHNYDATIAYTRQILPHLSSKSILVFDDIYWSDEMMKVWREIKAIPQVKMTIDTYNQGFVFFDDAILNPIHHTYIELKYKPWQIGLFQ